MGLLLPTSKDLPRSQRMARYLWSQDWTWHTWIYRNQQEDLQQAIGTLPQGYSRHLRYQSSIKQWMGSRKVPYRALWRLLQAARSLASKPNWKHTPHLRNQYDTSYWQVWEDKWWHTTTQTNHPQTKTRWTGSSHPWQRKPTTLYTQAAQTNN